MPQTTSEPPTISHALLDALHERDPWVPGRTTRALGRVSSRVRAMAATVDPLELEWRHIAANALQGTHPLWVVLGDSTAQGVGATSLGHGWVARLAAALAKADRRHGIVNLSRSGAMSVDVLHEQLPLLELLPQVPTIVTVTVGSNDLMRNPHAPALARRMRSLIAALPEGTTVGTLPAPSLSPTGIVVNRAIRQAAEESGHRIAEVSRHLIGPRRGLAADRFHPSDAGYGAWVAAFSPHFDIDPTAVPDIGTAGSAP